MRLPGLILWSLCLAVSAVQLAAAQSNRPFPTPTGSPTPTLSPTPTPEPKAIPCPQVAVQTQGPPQVRDGQPVSFALNIMGGDPRVQPNILWSVNAGTIKEGQNSRRITVDTTGAGASSDRELSTDVWVGGFAPECLLQAKAKIKIIPPPAKVGEVGELKPDAEANMLKVLGKTVSGSPDLLYVIAYAGRNSERGYAFTALRRMKEGLTTAGMDNRRVVTIDGGFREDPQVEFWIVPMGSEPPRPTPTLNRNEIVYPRPGISPQKKP